jgi:hypothetical protein
MALNLMKSIRKLFDPNYATKKVDVINRESSRTLREVTKISEEYRDIAKKGDVSMIIFSVAGGKHNGS